MRIRLLRLATVLFAGVPAIPLAVALPTAGSCDAQGVWDGTKWVMECVSYQCAKDCVFAQLGNPVGDAIPLSCVCPPANTTAECQSVFWHLPNGSIIGAGCFQPQSVCQTSKQCWNQPTPPSTEVLPVPAWDGCVCR